MNAMFMMFGHALRKAPFERALPFNENDLMILVSPSLGFRLCNVTTEDGMSFKIQDFMKDSKDIFGSEVDKRIRDFADIFPGRIERFFETKKNDYIFFDLEEQKFLRKLMSKKGLSCSVELYRYHQDRSPIPIDFLDLEHKEAMQVTKFMQACKIRAILNSRDYYYLAKSNHDETKERRFKYEDLKKNTKVDEMKMFFEKYPKLSSIKSKDVVNKYFKKLTVKYHPDNMGEDKTEFCSSIRKDFEDIKKTLWYEGLPDTGGAN